MGVFLSLILGIILGGISGYVGGMVDVIIQRIIEFLRSLRPSALADARHPALPLGLAAAAHLLRHHDHPLADRMERGWRVVRGRFMALRGGLHPCEARLANAPRMRIILRHMVPSFTSHLIASLTLSIPAMILSETSLSFLGLGLQPPIVKQGVLQEAQNLRGGAGAVAAAAGAVRRHRRAGVQFCGRRAACGRSMRDLGAECVGAG